MPRVLVVHESAMRALLTETVLTAAGCAVHTLTDSRELPASMASFQPDLILTATPLAQNSGVELAAVARGPDTLRLVPILVAAVDHRRPPRAEPLPPVAASDGSPLLAPELLVAAVNERIAAMRAIRQPAPAADQLDPDTGLATRRDFMQAVSRAIADTDSGEPDHGLMVVAVDGVAQLNGRLGTGAADLAADHVGQVIVQHLGPGDLAIRLDDYRHALLIRRSGMAAVQAFAETLQGAIMASPVMVSGAAVTTHVSIGVGLFRPALGDVVTMIKRAEDACAQASVAGGNRIVVGSTCTAGPRDQAQEQLLSRLIERALTQTDTTGGFQILYQPMVAIGRQVLCHVEVLLCLTAADGGVIEPADFLPVAERAGRVAEIDRWIMLRALAVLARQGATQPRLRLFIRQHVETLTKDGCLSWLSAQVAANQLAQRAPILELHIQDLLRHHYVAGTLVRALRKTGIQVCLAGVDHAPPVLELVKELRPSFVKLAPSATPDQLTPLVQRLSHSETEVIACGIDSPELVAPVWASGVGYAQGAVIYAPRAELVFDWDEVVAEPVE